MTISRFDQNCCFLGKDSAIQTKTNLVTQNITLTIDFASSAMKMHESGLKIRVEKRCYCEIGVRHATKEAISECIISLENIRRMTPSKLITGLKYQCSPLSPVKYTSAKCSVLTLCFSYRWSSTCFVMRN